MPVGVSFGLGTIGELQLDAGYTWFDIDSRTDAPLAFRVPADAERTHDVLDLVVATKIRLLAENAGRPAIAVRFATRLPNASNESGLGLDTTDFSFGVLVGKTLGSRTHRRQRRFVLLSNPLVGTIQDDAFVGGVSIARAITKGLELAAEVGGAEGLVCGCPAAWRRAARRGADRRPLYARPDPHRRRHPARLYRTIARLRHHGRHHDCRDSPIGAP